MTLSFHALWMLCAFGVVVHAATAARRARDLAALAAGFVVIAAMVASPQRLPDPAWVGVVQPTAAAGPGMVGVGSAARRRNSVQASLRDGVGGVGWRVRGHADGDD